jgi:hypothetical protein
MRQVTVPLSLFVLTIQLACVPLQDCVPQCQNLPCYVAVDDGCGGTCLPGSGCQTTCKPSCSGCGLRTEQRLRWRLPCRLRVQGHLHPRLRARGVCSRRRLRPRLPARLGLQQLLHAGLRRGRLRGAGRLRGDLHQRLLHLRGHCAPSCPHHCGEGDGCGGSCPFDLTCDETCTPSCSLDSCGEADRCGGTCPVSWGGGSCTPSCSWSATTGAGAPATRAPGATRTTSRSVPMLAGGAMGAGGAVRWRGVRGRRGIGFWWRRWG